MSAVAPLTDAAPTTPALRLVTTAAPSLAQIHATEANRWMVWFGLPVLLMAAFVGAAFATGSLAYLGGALGCLIADIGILIWLCMSSDTNGLIGTAPAH